MAGTWSGGSGDGDGGVPCTTSRSSAGIGSASDWSKEMRVTLEGTTRPVVWTTSGTRATRSEEHTSELQSPDHLVCRLLLEKNQRNPTLRANGLPVLIPGPTVVTNRPAHSAPRGHQRPRARIPSADVPARYDNSPPRGLAGCA